MAKEFLYRPMTAQECRLNASRFLKKALTAEGECRETLERTGNALNALAAIQDHIAKMRKAGKRTYWTPDL